MGVRLWHPPCSCRLTMPTWRQAVCLAGPAFWLRSRTALQRCLPLFARRATATEVLRVFGAVLTRCVGSVPPVVPQAVYLAVYKNFMEAIDAIDNGAPGSLLCQPSLQQDKCTSQTLESMVTAPPPTQPPYPAQTPRSPPCLALCPQASTSGTARVRPSMSTTPTCRRGWGA